MNKQWLLGIGAVIAISTASVFAATADKEVNFAALNPVMGSLLEVVIHGDDTVDFAYPKFDEKFSSMDAGKLKYDFVGALKNTPWLDGGVAHVRASSIFKTIRYGENPGVAVQATSEVDTDVFALIRYTGYMSLKKINFDHDAYEERMRGHFRRLSVTRSFEDLYQLILSGHQLSKESLASRHEKEKKRLAQIESGNLDGYSPEFLPYLKKKISRIERAIVVNNGFKFKLITENGKATGVEISGLNVHEVFFDLIQKDEIILPKDGVIRLGYQTIKGSGSVIAKMRLNTLDKLKVDLLKAFNGAIQGVEKDKQNIQRGYREALIQFKRYIQGDLR